MKMLIYSFLILNLGSNVSAHVRCESLFSESLTQQVPTKKKTPLSNELLEQEGFSLTSEKDELGNKITVLRDTRSENMIVGQIEISKHPFTYQWGDAQYQELNIAAGELKNMVIRRKIEGAPQTYGKGYYVSIDPYDSSMYGTNITVFKSKSEIIHIKQSINEDSLNLVEASTDMIYRLRRAGIEAIHSWKVDTWFSFIDNRNLKVAKVQSLKDSPEWKETADNVLNQFLIYNKLSQTGIERWLPSDHLLVKTIQKNLSKEDVTRLKLILAEMKTYEVDNTYGTGISKEDQNASIILINDLLKSYK